MVAMGGLLALIFIDPKYAPKYAPTFFSLCI